MNRSLGQVYQWAERWSRIGVLGTLALVGLLFFTIGELSLTTQTIIALCALLVGIPHGAIDHLISLPPHPRSRFLAYIFIYVAIALLSVLAIATWELNGFRFVLLMSVLHFGFGDSSYRNEELDLSGRAKNSLLIGTIYALPAGALPVILPLTDQRTLSALTQINPALVNWAGAYASQLRFSIIALATLSFILLVMAKKLRMASDLLLLFGLSLLAPPLIAFAAYFGFWHALRHTARLVPKLPSAHEAALQGNPLKSIKKAVIPGLYAVVGTLIVAAIAMVQFPNQFSSSLLWSTLVIVWALTVPHMMTTARFDLQALSTARKGL